jgi:hypothetical protein
VFHTKGRRRSGDRESLERAAEASLQVLAFARFGVNRAKGRRSSGGKYHEFPEMNSFLLARSSFLT